MGWSPRPDAWITWKESQVNSEARRAWTAQAASFLKANYRHGDGIMFSFGDLTGVLREAGIPLRESLYDGNNPQFLGYPRAPRSLLMGRVGADDLGRPCRDCADEAWQGCPCATSV